MLLTAPAAWHRLLFRTGNRERILTVGNRSVLVGLGFLAAAIVTTVALIAKVVHGPISMTVLGVVSSFGRPCDEVTERGKCSSAVRDALPPRP